MQIPKILRLVFSCLGIFLWAALVPATAQEPGQADLYTEAYTDVFEEHFFEALKERAKGNYDQAIAHLMECRDMDSLSAVVSYELGRNYRALKSPAEAESNLKQAVIMEPGNYWYHWELVQLFRDQNQLPRAIDHLGSVSQPTDSVTLLLVDVLLESKKVDRATDVLNALLDNPKPLPGVWERKRALERPGVLQEQNVIVKKGPVNPIPERLMALEALSVEGRYEVLLEESSRFMDEFPAQPEGYYYQAISLNALGKPEQAARVADSGLDFLLEGSPVWNNYLQFGITLHRGLGNTERVKVLEAMVSGSSKQ